MPRHCAAANCRNNLLKRDGPIHIFPREEELRRKWIRASHPSNPTWVPAKSDRLCGDHFLDEDYERSPKLLKSLGLPQKHLLLKPGVVPSVFVRKCKVEQWSSALKKPQQTEASSLLNMAGCITASTQPLFSLIAFLFAFNTEARMSLF